MATMPVTGLPVNPDLETFQAANLVVRNAQVWTGDATNPSASALACRDGRLIAVGHDADVAAHVGPATRVVDAVGRTVVPGLIDSHMHVIRTGLHYLLELRWDNVPTLRQALTMLREQAERTPPGQWVRVVGGWTGDQFIEGRGPTVAELNAVSPDTPIMVTHLYQSVVLNKAALRAVGIDRASHAPPGGEIVRDWEGNPTGLLLAAPAAGLLYSVIGKAPVLDHDGQVLSTRHFMSELNRFGLTSAIDAAGGFQNFPEHYAPVVNLREAGDLTMRFAYHLFPQTPGQELADIRRWIDMVNLDDGDEWLRCNGVGENLAWSPADFENFAEPRPVLADHAAQDLEAAVRLLVDNGWGFRLHATYDETIRMDLDVFEKIAADTGFPRGVRWILDHAETISADSIERVAALGGHMSVQHRMAYQGRFFHERYGPALTAQSPPFAAMLTQGLIVGAGTDAPRISSYNPWLCMSWLTTGQTVSGMRLYPKANLVDRATALRMYTTSGAHLTGEADYKGSLRVGNLADFAVLSADYFTVDDAEVRDIEALLTVVGGKPVFGQGDFADTAQPLPAITPDWSPVAHYGGYQRSNGGLSRAAAQVQQIVAAAQEANSQAAWDAGHGSRALSKAATNWGPC